MEKVGVLTGALWMRYPVPVSKYGKLNESVKKRGAAEDEYPIEQVKAENSDRAFQL